MKNLTNLGFVALLLVVLGCNCDRIKELAKQPDEPAVPQATPGRSSNTATSPARSSDAPAKLSRAAYDKLKDGMSRKEVEEILGGPGEEVSSSKVGKTTIASFKWAGDGYAFIFVNFTNDKLTFKSNANLK